MMWVISPHLKAQPFTLREDAKAATSYSLNSRGFFHRYTLYRLLHVCVHASVNMLQQMY